MPDISLPKEFCEAHTVELCRALEGSAEVSIRLNPAKVKQTNTPPTKESDSAEWHKEYSDTVEWCKEGRYLDHRPTFTLDPIHAAGGYYVQEASSMAVGSIVERILKDYELPTAESLLAVDLCAAPGGKSTHLSSVVGSNGIVVANEVIRTRAGILAQNVVRWGEGNTIVTSADSSVLATALKGKVDILVVDAPCSGEGMFRKDHSARAEWSMENVELCAARQRRIIGEGSTMLKPGGYMIYSTCTFNTLENDDNVEWMTESGDFEFVASLTESLGNGGERGSHFFPSEIRGEGLFVAALRYIGDNTPQKRIKENRKANKQLSQYSTLPMHEVEFGDKLYGYPPYMSETVEQLRSKKVHILMAGIEFGEVIRGALKPSHNFALYSYAADTFKKVEVSLETAREYLRKGTLNPVDFTEGLQLVTYKGLPLGFAKRIGGRVNNMYPTTWRIVNL
ncbi:MAG: rRNA cytosine-C5-methyltransferase [Rikenellaceae bacterium]